MDVLRIFGGRRVGGRTTVSGAKNAVMPIVAAAMLTDEPVLLKDCPKLSDTENMLKILRTLGAKCRWEGHDLIIDASTATGYEMPSDLSKALRSSIFMMGPLIGRFRKATVTYPGGCQIGVRPIDLHLHALRTLGIKIRETHGMIYCDGSSLQGAQIHLEFPSVGATENAMMAAVLAPGSTVIHNAAREPEIEDLAAFINQMGGDIKGSGSGIITINGVTRLHGTTYRPVSDRIVSGTLLTAAAMTGGEIRLDHVIPTHLLAVTEKLRQAGSQIEEGTDYIALMAPKRPRAIHFFTSPYPGFPTDMQAQLMAMCTLSEGTSVIEENLFENRFGHVSELMCMGADILVKGNTAIVRGGQLTGAKVMARDLRGGAALVLAGLSADGMTEVENTGVIDRGYESIERTFQKLGAKIERV